MRKFLFLYRPSWLEQLWCIFVRFVPTGLIYFFPSDLGAIDRCTEQTWLSSKVKMILFGIQSVELVIWCCFQDIRLNIISAESATLAKSIHVVRYDESQFQNLFDRNIRVWEMFWNFLNFQHDLLCYFLQLAEILGWELTLGLLMENNNLWDRSPSSLFITNMKSSWHPPKVRTCEYE